MSRDFNISLDRILVASAVDKLSPWFGLHTSSEIAETLALRTIQGFSNSVPDRGNRPPPQLTELVNLVTNTQDGALTTKDLITKLSELFRTIPNVATTVIGRDTTANYSERIRRFCKLFYETTSSGEDLPFISPTINQMLGRSNQGSINANPNSPSKINPGLSVMFINTHQIGPAVKNTNLLTVFFNGISPVEFSRAVPFIKTEFMFGREPTDVNNNLQTLSLLKFLEGAVNVGTTGTTKLLTDLNTIPGTIEGGRSTNSGILSTAGMELFCSPQTLVNPLSSQSSATRTVPVIDTFRPFLTFKALSVDVAPSLGLMSYKTAKMEFVLHDRSRMHEIADFIKPDLYGTTEILLEYGWSHPDKTLVNPYGVLINGLRVKEKYGIRNVNFNFDGAGQVNVTLELFMKGSNDFYTQTISQYENGTENIIRTIERLTNIVTSLERRGVVGNARNSGSENRTREIRGVQLLETASDWQSRLRLSSDMVNNLRDLETSLSRHASNENITRLRDSLRQLYQTRTSQTAPDNNGGSLAQLTTTTQRSIESRFSLLSNTPDLFIAGNIIPENITREARNLGRPVYEGGGTGTRPVLREAAINNTYGNNVISLAKLMLVFVGEPLANTHKYDDVQFVYYPFNQYAGFANTINIGQFPVDVRYFIQQYTRYRTENLSRAANMSLKEFVEFVANVLIDDPGAAIYGISDLYQEVRNRQTGEITVRPRGNSIEYQTRLENRMRERTPDGTFKMPQVDFYVECLPNKQTGEGQPQQVKSILKIHIFDKQASMYESQAAILASARENVLTSIGSIPTNVSDGEPEIRQSVSTTSNTIINMAVNEGLVERINSSSNTEEAPQYRILGGPKKIKEFLMSTMPYIIYGIQGSTIKGGANLASQQDPALSTVNMLRSFRAGPLQANGEQPGGLPLSIIPCELSLQAHGCPLLDFAQQFFVDFQTGTSADNIYGVTGLSHKISQGVFETEIKFTPFDAYGKYSSMIQKINQAATRMDQR